MHVQCVRQLPKQLFSMQNQQAKCCLTVANQTGVCAQVKASSRLFARTYEPEAGYVNTDDLVAQQTAFAAQLAMLKPIKASYYYDKLVPVDAAAVFASFGALPFSLCTYC